MISINERKVITIELQWETNEDYNLLKEIYNFIKCKFENELYNLEISIYFTTFLEININLGKYDMELYNKVMLSIINTFHI
jgi:hypothetical protein